MIFGHQHAHEAVAVQHKAIPFSPASTIVLWRCTCGIVTSQELAGRWTLAQVCGEPEPAVTERDAGGVPAGAAVATM